MIGFISMKNLQCARMLTKLASASQQTFRFSSDIPSQAPQLIFNSDEDLLKPEFMRSIEVTTQQMYSFYDENQITARISEYVSPKSLMDTYELYQKQISINHCVLILRIMARYPLLLRAHKDDTNFQRQMESLLEKVNQQMHDLNEIDLIDMLFWLRKLTTSGVWSSGPRLFQSDRFHSIIKQKVMDDQYALRNLISIYFDYAFLSQNADQISKKLVDSLKDPIQTPDVNFISSLTIMKSAVQRMFYQRMIDAPVVASFLDFALTKINESDSLQQSQLLIDSAKVRWHLYDPYFKLHPIFYRIDLNHKKNLNQIQEVTVYQILEAYLYLPNTFDSSLLDTLQKIIISTVKQEPDQLRTEFLFKMILPFLTMKKHFINQQCLDDFVNLLCQRINQTHDYFNREQKFLDLAVVLEIILLKINLNKENKTVFEISSLNNYKLIPSLFILHYKYNENIRSNLLKIKLKTLQLDQPSYFMLGILFEEYNLPLEELRTILYAMIGNNPIKLLQYTCSFQPTQWIEDVFTKISLAYQKQIYQRSQRNEMLKQVPRSLFNEKFLDMWQVWTKENYSMMLKDHIYERFFSCLSKACDYNDIPVYGFQFYEFLIKLFQKDLQPSFVFLLVRNQPETVQILIRNDEQILSILFQKLLYYNDGNEVAQLVFLLECWNLSHLIKDEYLSMSYHHGFSVNQKFNNQIIYFMIKYCCLPINQLALVFNNLMNPDDNQLKLLLLMIHMFQTIEHSSPLQEMVMNQINFVSKQYDHN